MLSYKELFGSGAILTGDLVGICCLEQRKKASNTGKLCEQPSLIARKVTQEINVRRTVINTDSLETERNLSFTFIAIKESFGASVVGITSENGRFLGILRLYVSVYSWNLNVRINGQHENFGRSSRGAINYAKNLVGSRSTHSRNAGQDDNRQMIIEGVQAK